MLLVTGYMRAFGRVMSGGDPLGGLVERHADYLATGEGASIYDDLVGPSGFYLALFEALNWAVTVEERLWREWDGLIDDPRAWYLEVSHGATMRGVRFARNRVHHQWTDAVELPDSAGEPPWRRDVVDKWEWTWPLPPGRADEEGERVYRESLAGESVMVSLAELLPAFTAGVKAVADRRREDPVS
jgi:hypothetical protein